MMRWSLEMQNPGHVCFSKRHQKKNHLNRIRVQASLYLALNYFALSLLNSDTGIYFFILCCISASFPRTEADELPWDIVLLDLEKIEKLNRDIDAKLYTASPGPDACFESVLRCFLEELKVIVYEGEDQQNETSQYVKFVNTNLRLDDLPYNIVPKECKQCEQFQEEDFATFMASFKNLVRSKISQQNS
uniref:Interleukin n=1 Tax=Geotrypetes seraphini TaxID=260995 RepID=A0A6P8QGG6_GEOSA|nr:interleukin-15 isoform X2 [Geotrypetes seraphini]XP_033795709.1 interleukin-15 isoform X2 [Geotrypetes seraphini]XP_033795719.1 interleukin-15 isoform X2 [Geotrypetes seraphini]XP_033795726.1 interleukin-15 isoform X2 [Geotrypetes seraphini]